MEGLDLGSGSPGCPVVLPVCAVPPRAEVKGSWRPGPETRRGL